MAMISISGGAAKKLSNGSWLAIENQRQYGVSAAGVMA